MRKLAEDLAGQPLLQRYRLGPGRLLARWRDAQAAGDQVWVAWAGRGAVGLMWFDPRGAFVAPYLRFMGLAASCQGQGLGTYMLRAFEAATLPAGRGWFLLAADSNPAAGRFYRRQGYRQVGRLPDLVMPGVEERIFHKAAK